MNIFEEVKKLALPAGEYIVLGSGILGALGIRKIADVDLLVSPRVFEQLRERGWKYSTVEFDGRMRQRLTKGSAEAYKNFWYGGKQADSMKMISEAQVVDGVPFLSLETVEKVRLLRCLRRSNTHRIPIDITLQNDTKNGILER